MYTASLWFNRKKKQKKNKLQDYSLLLLDFEKAFDSLEWNFITWNIFIS